MMSPADEELSRKILKVIYDRTGGNASATAGLKDIARDLEMDRSEIEGPALDLAAEGLAELRSLSGAMGLTEAGLAEVRRLFPSEAASGSLADFAAKIRGDAGELKMDAGAKADLLLDLDVLLRLAERSKPLPAASGAVWAAAREALAKAGRTDLAEWADKLAG